MNPLNSRQKQLIFDYCIGTASAKEITEAEALISTNSEAIEIHSKIQAVLSPLKSVTLESCPDSLFEKTLERVDSLSNGSSQKLQQLIALEQSHEESRKKHFRSGMFTRLAKAAVFFIVGSVAFATFQTTSAYLRLNAQKLNCQVNLSSIFKGLSSYISDHDQMQPIVEAASGAPWWKVGYQGKENQSNTRNIYLLVKGNYVKPSDFICSGNRTTKNRITEYSYAKKYKDFPGRSSITYSVQISCNKTGSGKLLCRKVIMSDMNPLFEELPDYNSKLALRLDMESLTLNSNNHQGHGQNVLFGDGRVEFMKTRIIGTDDIFTLQDTDIYTGTETPSIENDFFVAP